MRLQQVSMELIKKLRETTGSGMLDCKKALAENNDDLDAAVKWLREKGILKAQKKQDRETNEGVISFYNHETSQQCGDRQCDNHPRREWSCRSANGATADPACDQRTPRPSDCHTVLSHPD